jgi:peptidoglycan/xylan/chitin deacetylase (PgdA/CDA1 family)
VDCGCSLSMALAKSMVHRLFRKTGGLQLARYMNRRSLRIVMYHRFSGTLDSVRGLEQQCRHYRQCYSPISMTEAASRLSERRPLPDNALIVTVDDGHRDFCDIAWPIFSAYGIPVIVYLVTDFLDQRTWLWSDCIEYVMHTTPRRTLELPIDAERRICLPLHTLTDREVAIRTVKHEAKRVSNERRIALLKDLVKGLGVEPGYTPPPEYAPLSWDQVRTLGGAGVEFGAHTRSHALLSKVEDDTQIQHEILGSQRRIESILDSPARHFCYPNGDVSERSETIVRRHFDSATTTIRGINRHDTIDRFHLERVGVDPESRYLLVEQYLAGVRIRPSDN